MTGYRSLPDIQINSPITPILEQQGYVLLDGGLATELEKLGYSLNNKLWSASLLENNPQDIHDVHRSYLDAGANCITAASYQASIPGFIEAGYSENEAVSLIQKAVEIALDARDRFLRECDGRPAVRPLVAASIGPYGAYLADGSEFRGNYSVSDDELRVFHESRWQALCETRADLFAIETIPSFKEAGVLLEILQSTPDIQAWISFSCADGMTINDGTPLAECARVFADCEQIVAVGVNCTAPGYISSLIGQIQKGAPGKPVLVYPNSGEIYNGEIKTWKHPPDTIDFGELATKWFNLGANVIGACCRTGPGDISKMSRALFSAASQ